MAIRLDHTIVPARDGERADYAFVVSEDEFDAVYGRVRERAITHWADPGRTMPEQINHHDEGRAVYFANDDGHLLEIITRPDGVDAGPTVRTPVQ